MDAENLRTQAQELVLNAIPYGKDNAKPRDKLCEETHMDDRKVRAIIAELRAFELICSKSGFDGYWRPSNREEVKDFLSENTKRIKSLFKMCKLAREYLKNHEDQLHA